MSSRTVILSLGVHAAIAATLLGAAGKKALRKPTAVSFTEEKKKEKPALPKPPAPPPKVVKPVEHKVAMAAKEASAPVARAAPPPVETALTMSNDDASPGGIALPSREPAPKAAPAAAKVASAVTEARKQRMKEAATAPGEEAPCAEEPSKPEPLFKQEIEYTAAARAEGVEGRLKLRLTIGADGAVTKVDVVESVAPELDASAVAAAKQWRFKPALACGKPIAGGTYVLVRRFELGD
jgi:protein TonB